MKQVAMIILNNIEPGKGLKLTVTGKLPRKIVHEIYNRNFFRQDHDYKIIKVLNEDDYVPAGMGHILLKMSRFVRITKNTMHLTRSGRAARQNSVELFTHLFRIFVQKFNQAWFARYESPEIG